MLYLNPPYFLIDGVSIFPDHADPLQFYYLPMMPHLTVDGDGAAALPRLQLIEYRGAAGSGGFLNFDVNLGLAPDVLASVAQDLKRQAQLSDNPRLSPVTFVDGSVKLMLLGAESPPPPGAAPGPPPPANAATAAPGGPRFVVKIQNAVKPALFGDNQATFSVQLDQYGATILRQALAGELAPVAVVYSLDFIALRPAFNVHLSIDWDRVHTYLDDQFSGGFLFVSVDIDKAIDKLIEDRAIVIEIDSFIPDGDTSKSTSGDRDRAVGQVYDMIKETFFTPSMPPQGSNNTGGMIETARTIAQLVHNGGMALCSKKSVDLTQVDKKTLNVNIRERTAVQRTIYPQGHLSGLFDTLRRPGVTLDRFVTEVDLDNPYFQRRTLTVATKADFTADAIASIDVNLTYNGMIRSVTLTAAAPSAAVDWSSLLKNGQMVRDVAFSYTVNFSGSIDSAQRPVQLSAAPGTTIGDSIDIEPRSDLYAITTIPIRADNLPFDRYPNVEVECRYLDPVSKLQQQASALLTAQNNETSWQIFMRDRTQRSFEYRLTFALATGGTRIVPWTRTDEGKVDISDPMPSKINLTILPAVDWASVSQIILFVAYPGKSNPSAHQNFIINAQTATIPQFIAERPDGGPATVYYEARILGAHGHVWTVPGSVTTDSILTIQDGMLGHQIITVAPEAIDFATKHVLGIDVQLRYVDAKHAINATAAFTLQSQTDSQAFAFDYIDPAIRTEYSALIRLDNGQNRTIDWTPVTGSVVTVPLHQLD